MIKTDSIGDTLWTKIYGDTISPCAVGYSIRLTNDGGFIVTGVWKDKIYLMKTNADGDTLWTRTFTEGKANCVQQTSDGGYILVGSKYISALTGYDVYVIKTDSLGKVYSSTAVEEFQVSGFRFQVYPNPFSEKTTISFALPEPDLVKLFVYNYIGQRINTLFDDFVHANQLQKVVFSTKELAGGIFFAVLQGSTQKQIQKLVIIK